MGTDPAGLAQTAEIQLQASWLVCREECIPQEGNFRISVPVRGSMALHAAQFAAAQAAAPVAFQGKVEALVDARGLLLRVNKLPAGWVGKAIQALPETPELLDTPALPATTDINGPQWEGVTINQITTRKGLRESASTAYLRPALKRPNLRLITHALVERVVFEGQRASGVQLVVDGQRQVAQARREVLVCGGAVNSPALLQLSGVGDTEFLRGKGIAPVHHAPAVGRHMQDHLCHDHSYVARKPSLNQTYGTWSGKLWAGLRYVLARRGPMALGINHAGGFVRSDADEARPNFQLYFSPLTYSKPTPGKRQLLKPDAEPGFSISVQPCRPTSRGFIEVQDADPRTPPRIVTNALSTDYDVEQMRKAALFIRRFSQTPTMQALIAR
ncbi:MAG: hypothetical protein EBU97_06200, partial [Rhodobacteraceae bacterium]|nr:hypothetical protein [Paracoccaceae bacterium]